MGYDVLWCKTLELNSGHIIAPLGCHEWPSDPVRATNSFHAICPAAAMPLIPWPIGLHCSMLFLHFCALLISTVPHTFGAC
jgi:hypothetical protein